MREDWLRLWRGLRTNCVAGEVDQTSTGLFLYNFLGSLDQCNNKRSPSTSVSYVCLLYVASGNEDISFFSGANFIP